MFLRVVIPSRTARHKQAAIYTRWHPGDETILYGFRMLDGKWQCVAASDEVARERVSLPVPGNRIIGKVGTSRISPGPRYLFLLRGLNLRPSFFGCFSDLGFRRSGHDVFLSLLLGSYLTAATHSA